MKSHRYLADIVQEISRLGSDDEKIRALRSSRAVMMLCYFAYGPFELDLPIEALDIETIGPSAFTRHEDVPDFDQDLLSAEVGRLVKMFARDLSPGLTSARRRTIYLEIASRLRPGYERNLLEDIRQHRIIPGITRAVVAAAFPGMLDTPPVAEQPPEPPQYFDAPWPTMIEPVAAPPAPQQQHELTAEQSEYARRMHALGFW